MINEFYAKKVARFACLYLKARRCISAENYPVADAVVITPKNYLQYL